MELMIYVLYFLAALLALEGFAAVSRRQADPAKVKSRLRELGTRVGNTSQGEDGSILLNRSGVRLPSLANLSVLLYRAGGPVSVGRFFLFSLILPACACLTLYSLTQDSVRATTGIVTLILPYLWVRRLAAKRMRLFEEQLPESLELMTRTIRTGHSLVNGFQIVAEEMPDPVGTEFGLVSEEIRLGLGLREALDNLMRRVNNPDLQYFATGVLIQRQTGGNLAELLENLSTLLRERQQFSGRVRAMTAQGRGAATFLALWLPAMIVLMWFVAPGYLAPLIENRWGHIVLASAFGLDAVAYIMARRIADVQA